ncbi:hypothetical protein [Streptomyces gobiensis]|uniref:hypothetical protein n=1 Tax=Streptomyces gobiensis TaxID=2875706 RepID=UPI001E5A02F7|nr:hypothetical protein [Streptomyces gobiensis]UGY91274.1 hypothetical protein test1122_05775 [Streptomyces gobiensis]
MSKSATARNPQAAHRRDRIVMWTALCLGIGLFASSLLGNMLGFVVLPFDPHHVYGQVGGVALTLFGLTRWR